ncbi:uncharacterized protein N7511_005784 [Penicillium nucicola]|uniref:uncharacterized protein n=1 Tax=Penicillium nucicola TaxID=1850975 RepID=UPI002545AF3F|nr:uncharacterized protein N7511_005784 [Penicillium nucicola]KAJ5762402.1 hypothetical protein N7511_005784 [Penicillium nucicola]
MASKHWALERIAEASQEDSSTAGIKLGIDSAQESHSLPDPNESSQNKGSMAATSTHHPSENDAQQPSLEPVPEAQPETTELAQAHEEPQPLFSAFTKRQKLFIVIMVSLASFFSPLSGQIYYPIMPTLVKDYQLTPALINLTITTYMILQGLAPVFMGTFADTGGRRPAYIIAFAVYTAANIGLALQNSFAALMVLRCIQSAGSSGTVAFGYGVIADIATTAERGKYIGPMAAGVMVAPALGPVIGGLLAKFLGWRSVFWFLVVISGGYLVFFMIAMPETARKIVGNGGEVPTQWWRMSVLQWISTRVLRSQRKSDEEQRASEASQRSGQQSRQTKLKFPNPLHSVAILLEWDALIVISYVGFVMFANIALLTSTPNLFGPLYGLNELQIGICFLPFGISSCLGAVVYGKVIDYSYKRTAEKAGLPANRQNGDNLRKFPIERARLQTVFPAMAVGIAAFTPYGWVLQRGVPLAVPLVLQFIIGFCFVASLNCLNTLLVDLFPDRPATAAAACNLVRCCLGAVGAAVINQMLSGMGWGWCFVFLGLLMTAGMSLLWIECVYGMGWREKRLLKIERKEREEAAEADDLPVEDKTNEEHRVDKDTVVQQVVDSQPEAAAENETR